MSYHSGVVGQLDMNKVLAQGGGGTTAVRMSPTATAAPMTAVGPTTSYVRQSTTTAPAAPPPVDTSVPSDQYTPDLSTPPEEEAAAGPDYLLWGGIALGVVVLGAGVYYMSR